MTEDFEEQTVKTFEKAEEVVREAMKEKERCRNDDDFLIWYIKRHKQEANLNKFAEYRQTYNAETIRRSRAHIQNDEGELLPTDPEVMKKRKMKEKVVRQYFGKFSTQYQEYRKNLDEEEDEELLK